MVRLAFIPAFICISLFGADSSEKPATSFKIVSYNINWGNPYLSEKTKLLSDMDADIVLLQETNAGSEKTFRSALSKKYPQMYFVTKDGAGGFGVLSKVPLEDIKFMEPKYGWFGTLFFKVHLDGKTIQFVNVHLQPAIPSSNAGPADIAALLLKTERIRSLEIMNIWKLLDHKLPVVIAGDFNSIPSMLPVTFLLNNGLTDSFASVTPNASSSISWHWQQYGTDWHFRFDYIFHSDDLLTAESTIIEKEYSDHYPVVSIFRWNSTDKTGMQPGQP